MAPNAFYTQTQYTHRSIKGFQLQTDVFFTSSNIVIFATFTFLLLGLTGSRHICLLDCMHIELMDMDLFTATRVHGNNQQSTSEFSYKSQVCLSVCQGLPACLSVRLTETSVHCIFMIVGLKAAEGEVQTEFDSGAQLGLGI